jgi:BolA family transcriptional regulator, general stress-responsive regulator
MRVQEAISRKLTETFAPLSLQVLDESHHHEGHAGHRPGGETHFRIYIVAGAFRGKSRIARHRMINETLAHELKSGVHALAIHAAAPDESAENAAV